MIDEKKLIEEIREEAERDSVLGMARYVPLMFMEEMVKNQPKIDDWIPCNMDNLPGKEVLCCDNCGEMILGYVFGDKESETGFSAEGNGTYMYNCAKWMEKPKP